MKKLSGKFPFIGSLGDKRTAIVVKNSFVSGILKMLTLACSLLMVPITIGYLNQENYGIWMAMTSILYWFVFLDVGLGNGLRNYLAEALSRNDLVSARSYISTAYILLSIISVLLAFVFVPLIYVLDMNEIFHTSSIDGTQLANVLAIAVVFSLIQFVAKNVGMVYIAMQKYALSDLITFLGTLSALALVFIMTKTMQSDLAKVVAAFSGMPVLVFILASIHLVFKHPELRPSFCCINLPVAKKIVSKGVGFFLIQVTSCLVIFGSANIFISHYCGPEQVTVYNVSFKLFNVLIIIYTILISPLWNAYTDAAVKNDYAWIHRSFKKSLLLWALSVLVGIVMFALSGIFFRLWIGDSVEIPMSVSLCVFIYVCMFNFNNCVTYLINGLNKIRVQIITSILATALYLVCIFFIKDSYGIIGISLSMTVAYLLMAVVHLYQCYLLINRKAKGIWDK